MANTVKGWGVVEIEYFHQVGAVLFDGAHA